jgi:hypothetical protein
MIVVANMTMKSGEIKYVRLHHFVYRYRSTVWRETWKRKDGQNL